MEPVNKLTVTHCCTSWCWVVVVWYFAALPIVFGDLHVLPVKCGTFDCGKWEYCSDFETKCKPCADICNETIHNRFDPSMCKKDCQDYLHDTRYMSTDSANLNVERALAENKRLIVINQVLIAIIFIIIFTAGGLLFWCWKKKNNVTLADLKQKYFSKRSDRNANNPESANGITGVTVDKPNLRLNIANSISPSDTLNSPVTNITSISRRPAEDNTLDYAYDNPAMSSPSPNSRPIESTF